MQAKLYINTSDMRYLSKNLTNEKIVNDVILKDNTSDKEPTIILTSSVFDKSYNYVWLSTFNRYYAVVGKDYSQQKIILRLSRDAKASFVNEIKLCDCYAIRSNNKYNSYLNDSLYPHLQFTNPVIKAFPVSMSNTLSAVLTIAGGAGV